jgi:hypothetical protein
MKFRIWFAGAALAACIAAPIASNATTITGSLAAWEAAVGSYATTTSTGLPLYTNPVTEIALDDGMQLGFAGADDTVLQPGNGWIPWTSGYTGDIIDTTSNTETISFASSLSALGLQISPDLALFGSPPETFTVTLSDGTTAAISVLWRRRYLNDHHRHQCAGLRFRRHRRCAGADVDGLAAHRPGGASGGAAPVAGLTGFSLPPANHRATRLSENRRCCRRKATAATRRSPGMARTGPP